MKTTFDNFIEDLEVLFKKYNYTLSSAKEEINHSPRLLIDLWSAFPSLRTGMLEKNLTIKAIRIVGKE